MINEENMLYKVWVVIFSLLVLCTLLGTPLFFCFEHLLIDEKGGASSMIYGDLVLSELLWLVHLVINALKASPSQKIFKY